MLDREGGEGRWRVLCECACMGTGHKSLTESARSIGAEVNPTCWSKSNYKRIRHTSTTLCFRNTTAYPLPQTHSPARPAQSWIDRHKPRASFRRPSDALNSTREIANCPACGLLKLSLSLSLSWWDLPTGCVAPDFFLLDLIIWLEGFAGGRKYASNRFIKVLN